MIDTIANSLSYITRSLAFVPGMYFVTKPLHKAFTRHYSKQGEDKGWRVISVNGYKLKVNITHRMAALIYWRGAHEWAALYLLRHELKKGMVVYDIGANIGEMSIFSAHLLGEGAKVFSFEPMKETYKILKENIALNGYENRVKAFDIALSDKTGEADLYAATEYNENGSFEDGLHTLYATNDRSVKLQTIRMETLDSKQGELPAPDFIKLDVEGAELHVLKGAGNTLKTKHPKIVLEFNKDTFEAAGYSQREVLDFLRQFDYKFFTVETRGRLEKLDEANMPELVNLLCV